MDIIEVPYEKLEESTLQSLIREFVIRESSHLEADEQALSDKERVVKNALISGGASVYYNPKEEFCYISTK